MSPRPPGACSRPASPTAAILPETLAMMVCSDPLAAVWREALPEVAEKLAATLRLGPPAQPTPCDVPAVNYFFLIPKTTHTTPHIYSSSDISLFVVKDIIQYHGFQLHGVAQECMNSGLCASYVHNEVCSVFGCPFHRLGPSASHICQQLSTRSSSFRYFLPPSSVGVAFFEPHFQRIKHVAHCTPRCFTTANQRVRSTATHWSGGVRCPQRASPGVRRISGRRGGGRGQGRCSGGAGGVGGHP